MTEPRRELYGISPESQVDHRNDKQPGDDIERGNRFRSRDYGTGTVVAVLSIGIQIYWDTPLTGTLDSHLLVHDRSYVLTRLERI
jgi:hypothetical protein